MESIEELRKRARTFPGGVEIPDAECVAAVKINTNNRKDILYLYRLGNEVYCDYESQRRFDREMQEAQKRKKLRRRK